MSAADPAGILDRAGLWVAELLERGQVDEAAAARLNETLAESRGERLDHEDDPLLVIMLCGPTAVGKSSLINALAGAEISRPGLAATTRAAVLYVHEDDDPARLFEYSQALGSNENGLTELVRHRRAELLHKVLVDTPDIDSVRLQHAELTQRLVHAADLVLFVTSPEKYKVMRSARWVLAQRQQRGMAFVLNKWDREALGLQHERREEIAADFRSVLVSEGFPDPIVFKVSALAQSDDIENDLPALRAWLEAGIGQSTATAIRRRRLRAAWGRLAAAIEPAVPEPLSGHPLLPEFSARFEAAASAAEQRLNAEATTLEPAGLEDSGRPVTPGVLGMWTRTRNRIAATTATLRSGLSMFSPGGASAGSRADAFGGQAFATLADAVEQLVGDAAAARLPLGPVGVAWRAEVLRLKRELGVLPLDVATELMTEAGRSTIRRVAGIGCIYAFEVLIVVVLLIAVGRVGIDFVGGNYAPAGLFITALELVSILLIIGNITANLFFPPLLQRLRRMVAQRARAVVRTTLRTAQSVLAEHVEAVDRLARDGRALLTMIDVTVLDLTRSSGREVDVNRMFGLWNSEPDDEVSDRTQVVRRPPAFD